MEGTMKILIVKTSALGDIVHAIPILNYLQLVCPQAQIDWVAEKSGAAIVKAQPQVNTTFEIETKSWRKGKKWNEMISFFKQLRKTKYDVLFDLQGNFKSGFIVSLAKAKVKVGFGPSTVHEWPNLLFTNCRYNPPSGQNVRQENLFLVQSYFGDFRLPKATPGQQLSMAGISIMVCPGSFWPNKQLAPQTLKGFLDKIADQVPNAFFHFVWGTPQEREFVADLQKEYKNSCVIDKLTLPALQTLMRQMKLVIAMDSLPLHLAGTTSTLTYSFFGASSANKYNPLGGNHKAIQGTCPYGRTFERRCPILRTCPTGACIKGLEPEQIWNDFWPWFKNYL